MASASVKISGENFIECIEVSCAEALDTYVEDCMKYGTEDYGDLFDIKWKITESEKNEFGEYSVFLDVTGHVDVDVDESIQGNSFYLEAIAAAAKKNYGNLLVKSMEIED